MVTIAMTVPATGASAVLVLKSSKDGRILFRDDAGLSGSKDAPDAKLVSRALIAHAPGAPVRIHFPTQGAAIFGKTNAGSSSGEVSNVMIPS